MGSALSKKLSRVAVATSIFAAAATAFAATAQPSTPTEPVVLAQASGTIPTASTPAANTYPPLEAGVRKAASEGTDALRRYIFRTRMIYGWYYPNFAKEELNSN